MDREAITREDCIANLRDYRDKLEHTTLELNIALDLLNDAKLKSSVNDTAVKKLLHQKSTIEEAIRIEKKIFESIP